ncbi:DMT family transporter [Hymenobacter saemangeumensis]|uniref:DMT family transporter n=2 Tax=Hymenobacter saemangeumensis TaxID=1084522 RepID=A0ABP8IHX1_9BACT
MPAVLLAIVSMEGGAAVAKGLFPVLGPAGTVSLRIGFSALLMLALIRPPLRQLQGAQWRAVIPFGLALGMMNFMFYSAMARLPLGLAVAVGFVGPLGLALAGSRQWLDVVWVALAGVGIALIVPWSGQGPDVLGLVFALAGGACWALYIVLGQRSATVLPGHQAVAVGLLIAALLILPFGLASGRFQALTPHLLSLGVLTALFSSMLPFSLEMRALRSMPTRTFSILMSLEPVVAALLGWLVLHEHLSLGQWVAVACIVVASAGATLTARRPVPIVSGD